MKKLLIILLSIQILFAVEVKELKKGDTIEDSVERLEKKYYEVGVQNGKTVEVKLTHLTSDVDLYIRMEIFDWEKKRYIPVEENLPAIRKHDCYSANSNTEDEECTFVMHGPAPGGYDVKTYILVYGFKSANYTLEVKEIENERIDELSENPIKGEVEKGESRHYIVNGKAGETISVSLYDLTADADLRLRVGKKANRHSFDCKSIKGGTKTDSCSVTLEKNSFVSVEVYGYQGTSYSIKQEKSVIDPIITKAKDICLNNSKINDITAVCLNDYDMAYLMYFKRSEQEYHFYAISTSDNWSVISKKIMSDYILTASVHFLEDTPLVLVKTFQHHSGTFDVYYADKSKKSLKKLLSFTTDDSWSIDRIKTLKNGTQLLEKFHNRGSGEEGENLYDISDLNNVHLIERDNNSKIIEYANLACSSDDKEINSVSLNAICNDVYGQKNEAFVLDRDASKLFYVYNNKVDSDVKVNAIHNATGLYKNSDSESYTVAYYDGKDYIFYMFDNGAKKVLTYKVKENAHVEKVYIAQRNSHIWQIYLKYKVGDKMYKDTYISTSYNLPYTLESHREI